MNRQVPVSQSESQRFRELKASHPEITKKIIYSFFPCDRYDCECQKVLKDIKNTFSTMTPKQVAEYKFRTEFIRCPRDKSGMNKYRIFCAQCDEVVGECYATDETLSDFCDFHYIVSHDGEHWCGALTPQLSPIDQKIGIECCCGNDTRDFRNNDNLSDRMRKKLVTDKLKFRKFGFKGDKSCGYYVQKID